jgi:hypothetical protein
LTISYNPDVTVEVTGCGGACGSSSSSGDGGGGDPADDREPFTVPFGGEFYLLMLVAGYGIYTLSRRGR